MDERRDAASDRYRLGFMFRTIPVSKIALDYWLSVPSFVAKINDMMDHHIPVNNETVLEAMEEIYDRDFEPVRNTPDGLGMNFYRARKAINQLRRAVSKGHE